MDRCPHSSTQVRRARSHITIALILGELNTINTLHRFEHLIQVAEHIEKIRALFHAHDSKLILFPEPDDTHLVVRLPASTSIWPIRRDSSAFEVRISIHILEHHMRIHQILVLFLREQVWVSAKVSKVWSQRMHLTAILLLELVKSRQHLLLKLDAFVLAHFSRKVESEKIPSNTDPHRELVLPKLLHIIVSAIDIPVGDVLLLSRLIAVIITNDFVEEATKLGVV
mmetsp:Transcript_29315/g.53147  ORF Transcript_29315/g.53147 Transcript_29315/m.53147 type:complete len:226 (-) Transcript_29315:97-774(-)